MKNGWEIKKLEEFYEITSSKRVFKSEWKKEGVPFYRAREIVKLANMGFVKNDLFISEDMYNQYSQKYGIPKENDIMVTGVGTLGICYLVKKNDKFYFKDGNIIWLKTKNNINSRFVEYAFKSNFLTKQINDGLGATVGTFTIIKAKNTLIPVPSMAEQTRIVCVLNKAFTEIAKAKENAEKNLQNVKELLENYLENVFENRGNDWEEKKLSEVCAKITDGTHQTPKYFNDGFIFLSSKNVTSGKIDWKNIRYIDEKQHFEMQKRVSPKLGDILLAKNGTTGVAAIVDREVDFDIYVSLAMLRVLGNVSPDFMLYFINSPVAKKQFNKRLKGMGVPNLHLEEIREVLISFPKSLSEQKAVVKKLNEFNLKIKKLEDVYRNKLADLEELKKSILQKAFSGEL